MRDLIKESLETFQMQQDMYRCYHDYKEIIKHCGKYLKMYLGFNYDTPDSVRFFFEIDHPKQNADQFNMVFVEPVIEYLKRALKGVGRMSEIKQMASGRKIVNVLWISIPATLHPKGTRDLKGVKINSKQGVFVLDEHQEKKYNMLVNMAKIVSKKYNIPIVEKQTMKV